jgi:diguanylate cyclase (GGDEF)-like protein
VQAARRHGQVALLFLGPDGLERVNDAHGNAAGDAVLQQVAARMIACLRISDAAGRDGGDEFVVLLPDFVGQGSAAAVVEKIRARVESPYFVGHTEFRLATSIGVAVDPVDGQQYGELIQVSDDAMYANKGRGRRRAASKQRRRTGGPPMASIQPWSTTMQRTTPEQTRAEENFDRVREEAFSNEGAPPARPGRRGATTGAESGEKAAPPSVTPVSTGAALVLTREQGRGSTDAAAERRSGCTAPDS